MSSFPPPPPRPLPPNPSAGQGNSTRDNTLMNGNKQQQQMMFAGPPPPDYMNQQQQQQQQQHQQQPQQARSFSVPRPPPPAVANTFSGAAPNSFPSSSQQQLQNFAVAPPPPPRITTSSQPAQQLHQQPLPYSSTQKQQNQYQYAPRHPPPNPSLQPQQLYGTTPPLPQQPPAQQPFALALPSAAAVPPRAPPPPPGPSFGPPPVVQQRPNQHQQQHQTQYQQQPPPPATPMYQQQQPPQQFMRTTGGSGVTPPPPPITPMQQQQRYPSQQPPQPPPLAPDVPSGRPPPPRPGPGPTPIFSQQQQQYPQHLQQQQPVQYPHQQQQQQQQQQEQVRKPKIDPSQIPRPHLFTYPQQRPGEHQASDSGRNHLPVYYTKSSAVVGTNSRRNDASVTSAVVPPSADTRYYVTDDGYASPNLIRSTMYSIPYDRGILGKTGNIPMGLVCTPLAVHSSDFVPTPRRLPPSTNDGQTEEEWKDPESIPLVLRLSGEDGQQLLDPLRCDSCAAYVNPMFNEQGSCNMCGARNRHLASNKLQKLTFGTPTLQLGTVEYDVAGPYITRGSGPVQPVNVYAIDLTCPKLHEYVNILELIGQDLAIHYDRQQQQSTPRIGVCWFSAHGIIIPNFADQCNDHNDNGINGGSSACQSTHHHNLSNYVIAADVQDEPFSPIPLSQWTFDVSKQSGLDMYRRYLNNLVQDGELQLLLDEARRGTSSGNDGLELTCAGAACAFLSHALEESGGRGTVITWRRPNYGVGNIPYREERGFAKTVTTGAPDDCAIFTPLQLQSEFSKQEEAKAAKFYTETAQKCTRCRIALDIVMHTDPMQIPQPYLDLATLGHLCKVTCGRLIWITDKEWKISLRNELVRQFQIFSGWDTVFKVRCSDGIRVKSFLSSNCGTVIDDSINSSPELEMTCVSSNTCIVLELEHRLGGIPKDRPFVFVQTALLYTNIISGKRRVRVSTLAIKTTSTVNDVFKSVDFSATTTYLLRSTLSKLHNLQNEDDGVTTIRKKAREHIYNHCVLMLSNYRKNTPGGQNSPPGQLILPEKMQLLPLFCMCILKCPMLRATLPRPAVDGSMRPTPTPSCDERAYYNWHIGHVHPSMSMLLVHPNLFPVSLISQSSQKSATGLWFRPDGHEILGYVHMPASIPPSLEMIQDDAVYLLDDGLRLFLYIGKLVPDHVREAVTNADNLSDDQNNDEFKMSLKQTKDSLIWQILTFSSITRGSESEFRPTCLSAAGFAGIHIVYQPEDVRTAQKHPKQQIEIETVQNLMVADASLGGERDYVDFLCTLYKRVRDTVQSNAG